MNQNDGDNKQEQHHNLQEVTSKKTKEKMTKQEKEGKKKCDNANHKTTMQQAHKR